MLVLMSLINRMHQLNASESYIISTLQDLEANAFPEYIQNTIEALGLEPSTSHQLDRLMAALPKWESAYELIKMQRGA